MGTRRSYTHEFRAKVLAAVKHRPEGTKIVDIAQQFKIRVGLIYAWMREFDGKARRGLPRAKMSGPRKMLKRHSVAGWMKFSLNELRKERPNIEVARAYLTLAEHAMHEEFEDGQAST